LATNEVNLSLDVDDRNGDSLLLDSLVKLLLHGVVISFLDNEWNWSLHEEFVTLLIEFHLGKVFDLNITVSIMFESFEHWLRDIPQSSQSLSLIFIKSLEECIKSMLLSIMVVDDLLSLSFKLGNSVSDSSLLLFSLSSESVESVLIE